MGSADAVLRDYQDNVIVRAPLPLLFNISGRGKQPVKPKRAQKRAVRGVTAQQHSNYCTSRLNSLFISDVYAYLVALRTIPTFPEAPSVGPSAQDPQHVDNGTAQEFISSHMWIPAGDNLQTSK